VKLRGKATRFRVLRIYNHNNTKTAIDFLKEVREHFPFAIHRIQTDNDSSFGPRFTWHLSDLSISHRHIPPRCPEVNGKVERSHKTDSEEFYRGRHFRHKKDLARKLKRWEAEYNEDRPHLADLRRVVSSRPPSPVRTGAAYSIFLKRGIMNRARGIYSKPRFKLN
jgi:transposase InsO family protein